MAGKRFWESEDAFKKRLRVELAAKQLGDKSLYRVDAIEMRKNGQGWTMGRQDHFTVEAWDESDAIGAFKLGGGRMNWFVTGVEKESVI